MSDEPLTEFQLKIIQSMVAQVIESETGLGEVTVQIKNHHVRFIFVSTSTAFRKNEDDWNG